MEGPVVDIILPNAGNSSNGGVSMMKGVPRLMISKLLMKLLIYYFTPESVVEQTNDIY